MAALNLARLSPEQIVTDEAQRSPSEGLIASLGEEGLLRPIDVREREDGRYELVDGSRRLGGAGKLGWAAIDPVVEPAGDDRLPKDLKALLLNTQRQNLQRLYLAKHARRLIQQKGWTQAEVARRTHQSRSALCRMLKVLDCPDLAAARDRHELEFGAALAPLPPDDRRQLLAELDEIAERDGKRPAVREVEERVRCWQGGAPAVALAPERLAAVIVALRARGIAILARPGKRSRLAATLTLAKADLPWLGEGLTAARRRPGLRTGSGGSDGREAG